MRIRQLSQALNVPLTEICYWERTLNLNVPRDGYGLRLYDTQWVEYFSQMQQYVMAGKTWQEIALSLGTPPQSKKIIKPDKDLDGIIIYALVLGTLGGAVSGSFIGSFINETNGIIIGSISGIIIAIGIIFILGFLGRLIFDIDGLIYGIMSGTGVIFIINIFAIPEAITGGIKGIINGSLIGGLIGVISSIFIILLLVNRERL